MRVLRRVCVLTILAAIPLVSASAAPASAGVIDCTLGFPTTLNQNPNDPTNVTVYPQLSARGPVDYAGYTVNASFGYANCVL